MATREEAKENRRNRILTAARELIGETEKTRFSMRVLAERSGVSLVTPYNLFGSKQAIMGALLDEDIRQFGAQLARSRRDALDMLFRAVTLGQSYFGRDQGYYRAVLSAVYSEGGSEEYRSMFRGPRLALWRNLVQAAIDKRFLRSDVDCNVLAGNLSAIYFANILAWAAGEISLQEMEQRTCYGFAMSLFATARSKYTARLREQICTAQNSLVRIRKERIRHDESTAVAGA